MNKSKMKSLNPFPCKKVGMEYVVDHVFTLEELEATRRTLEAGVELSLQNIFQIVAVINSLGIPDQKAWLGPLNPYQSVSWLVVGKPGNSVTADFGVNIKLNPDFSLSFF